MSTTDTSPIGDTRDLSVAIIGPGRVGISLGLWLKSAGARVRWVVGRTPESTRPEADRLGAQAVEPGEVMQQSWDLMLLAVPDAMLTSVAADLAVSATQPRTGIALHTCGSQGALALDPLQAIGIHTGTLHPLLGFPAIRQAPEPDVVYATDGDPRAMDLARHLATAFEGSAIEVAAEERLLYHYCATLAAGGVSTVLAVVDEIVGNAGLNASVRRGYLRLAQAAIAAAGEVGDASETITGPIARGETGLAAAQLAGASHAEPALKPFLQALHAETGRQLARTRQREDNPGQDPCR